jgi:hypothetical protein
LSLNGSGSYSAPAADFPAVANTLIESTKFNNIINDIATALSTAVYKDGQQTVTANIPMGGFRFTGLGAGSTAGHSLRYEQLFTTSAVTLLGALDLVKGADIASAGTLNLTTATGNGVHVTGTTTITAVTLGSGMWRLVVFDGALTLTHHATNNNLPGGANITTAAGDRALYWADGTTVYCAVYMKANGKPIAGASGAITSSDFTMSTARLLGRTTASTGAIEEISVGASLTLSGGSLSGTAASDTQAGVIEVAIQSEMETGSSTTLAVTPGRQQYHPSAAKVWGQASASGTLIVGYNVTSITDTGTGVATVVVGTDFSTDNVAVSDVVSAVGTLFSKINGTPTTSSFAIIATTADGTPTDPDRYMFCAFGDQL